MPKSQWVRKAKQLLGRDAIHIGGDAQFAFITPCRNSAFSLWPTREEAEQAMAIFSVSSGGCMGRSHHYICDLGGSN